MRVNLYLHLSDHGQPICEILKELSFSLVFSIRPESKGNLSSSPSAASTLVPAWPAGGDLWVPGPGRLGGWLILLRLCTVPHVWLSPRWPEAAGDLAITPGLAGWLNLLPKACVPENFFASRAQEIYVFL